MLGHWWVDRSGRQRLVSDGKNAHSKGGHIMWFVLIILVVSIVVV